MSSKQSEALHVWCDGHIIPHTNALLPVATHALHYASAVFEGERVYEGQIFKSLDHTNRLISSAKLLDFELPFSGKDIENAKREVVEHSGLENAYVRAIAWHGTNSLGVSSLNEDIRLAIIVWDWPQYYADGEAGIKLGKSRWSRPPPTCARQC